MVARRTYEADCITVSLFWDDDEGDVATVSRPGSKRIAFEDLKRLHYEPLPRRFAVDPFGLPAGSDVVFDVECYWNYFMVGFKHIDTGQYFYVEQLNSTFLNTDALRRCLWHFRLIGFNSRSYDLPVIEAALTGATNHELKLVTNEIIKEGKRLANPNSPYNHVDIMQVAPLKNSLKGYGGNLHAPRLQEMPIGEDAWLSDEDIAATREYNFNDLDTTELLFVDPKYGLRPHVELRERLGVEVGEDLRSKSDAQVAEAFINARIASLTGKRPKTPDFNENFSFRYDPPAWVNFGNDPQLNRMLDMVKSQEFRLDAAGGPIMPPALAKMRINIGICTYKMGMGGLHSQEKNTAYKSDADTVIIDVDVASYYPWIIINNNLFPEHIGPIYLNVYRDDLVLRRLALKKLKDKLEAGLKIAINGAFGKQGNKWSTIFAPKLMIQTTMTGQLGLLMEIKMYEDAGFVVLSANTDGVVVRVPKWRIAEFREIKREWMRITGFELEETHYAGILSRDVNNYIAIKYEEKKDEAGKPMLDNQGEPMWDYDKIAGCKPKGTYSERGSAQNSVLSKNADTLICSDAVMNLLQFGTPIEQTIRGSQDIRRFVVVRNVKGGAHKDGWYLGKAIRWYYAKGISGEINYVISGNKVSNSIGAKPLMELGSFPADVDFEYYERKAYSMLRDLGYFGGITRQKTLF
jgi:hypothetical protein